MTEAPTAVPCGRTRVHAPHDQNSDSHHPCPGVPITSEYEDELRKRVDAATDGHWGVYYDGKGTHTIEAQPRLLPDVGTVHDGAVATITGEHGDDQAYRDSEFIARSREDMGVLLAELDRVRAERNRYRNAWHNARSRATDGYSDAEIAEQSRDRWREATLKAEAERDSAILGAASKDSEDWDDDTWGAWWRTAGRAHGDSAATTG